MNYINDRRMLLDYQRDRLAHGLTGAMGRERERFARLAAALDAQIGRASCRERVYVLV